MKSSLYIIPSLKVRPLFTVYGTVHMKKNKKNEQNGVVCHATKMKFAKENAIVCTQVEINVNACCQSIVCVNTNSQGLIGLVGHDGGEAGGARACTCM